MADAREAVDVLDEPSDRHETQPDLQEGKQNFSIRSRLGIVRGGVDAMSSAVGPPTDLVVQFSFLMVQACKF